MIDRRWMSGAAAGSGGGCLGLPSELVAAMDGAKNNRSAADNGGLRASGSQPALLLLQDTEVQQDNAVLPAGTEQYGRSASNQNDSSSDQVDPDGATGGDRGGL